MGIFLFFIFLCVFIVGHCSDQVDLSVYIDDAEFDDDEMIIATRWCGSRTLYSLWVVTVLITGEYNQVLFSLFLHPIFDLCYML